jgi:hypothetical protein
MVHAPKLVVKPADDWITSLAPGKSFADIGGLWGLINEKASVAMRAGASSVTMIDIAPQDHELWSEFENHLNKNGLPTCERLSYDATSEIFANSGRMYDVIHCSGIIYHLPSPYRLIETLWRVTRETLILTSMTVPEIIENDAGSLDLTEGLSAYIPGLRGKTAKVVQRHFELMNLQVHTITTDMGEAWCVDGQPNFGPWWWLITPSLLQSMAETVGFEILETFSPWEGRSTAVVCRKPSLR